MMRRGMGRKFVRQILSFAVYHLHQQGKKTNFSVVYQLELLLNLANTRPRIRRTFGRKE